MAGRHRAAERRGAGTSATSTASASPAPIGVFRAVERPVHHELEAAQTEQVRQSRGEGDLEKLLNSGDTWVVS